MKKSNLSLIVCSLIVLFSFGCATKEISTHPQEERISRPMQYSGYTKPEYKGFRKFSEYVKMSDGVQLAVDIYLPTEGPAREKFPVAFNYLPYTRAFIDLKDGALRRIVRKKLLGVEGPVIDHSNDKVVLTLLSYGYAFVIADMRGTGASFGHKIDFMPQFADDGAELIDWIASQKWSDGNVGMYGGSYLGYSQVVTAGKASSALKCIVPTVVPLDGYDGEVYPGGVYLHGFMSAYSKGLTRLNLNYYSVSAIKAIMGDSDGLSIPAAPVVDEDNDGELIDEIPIDLNKNGTFLDDYKFPDDPSDEPKYIDGAKRKHIYFLATFDHKKNLDYHEWAKNARFVDGETPKGYEGLSTYDMSPSAHVPAIMKKNIAIYNIGGWFDTFTRGTTELYSTMRSTNPSKMTIAPMYHSGGGPFWKYLGEDPKDLEKNFAMELVRFYDKYLKGIDNGIDREPPIFIYVMNGGGFRTENEWPLARQKLTDFYFNADNSIAQSQNGDGKDEYKADFTHDSTYGAKRRGNRFLGAMGRVPDELPIRTDKDKQCLSYTSAAMSEDVEVTGHPIVKLWVSSSADYGDFFVYLEDVDPDGRALLVTEGDLRAEFAKIYSNDEMIFSGDRGINVLPELPWHGFEKSEYVDAIFKNGNVVELVFDLKPTSWVFKSGHKIRVSIAAADWPTFELHPKLAPTNDPANPANIVPTISVYRTQSRPSGIVLPVIPK